MKKSLALAVVSVLALSGCSAGQSFPETYRSVDDLRVAFENAGGTCEAWDQANQVKTASESGTCGPRTVLSVYTSEAAASNAATTLKELSAGQDLSLLVGKNWIINAPEVSELDPSMGGTFLTSKAGTQKQAATDYCTGFTAVSDSYEEVARDLFNDEKFAPRQWNSVNALLSKFQSADLPTDWQANHEKWMSLRDQINESIESDGAYSFTSDRWQEGQSFFLEECAAVLD